MTARRLWFDVSFTRTQQGNIGITRTVRRLFSGPPPEGLRVGAVAFHSDGFREVELPSATGRPAPAAPAPSAGQRLFAWVTGGIARRLVILALRLLPWAWLQPLWAAAASFTFSRLSGDQPRARFAPGDVLVIADVGWMYPVWRAAQQARSEGASVLLVVYDLMPIRHPEFCFAMVPNVFATFLRRMLACSDGVLCISRATEDDLRQWARAQGLALPPTGFFHLGSDGVGAPAATEVRAELAAFLAGPQPCFAAVGSFEPKKNYPLLVRVFERLWAEGHAFRLVIAGKATADCAAFTQALRDHPQQGRLLLTLHDASDAEVAAIYAGCRALVFPSLFEGFGLPLVEARARGCRVIASDIAAFAELADAGVTLFDPRDEAALASAVRSLVADAPRPPAYDRGLTWTQSTAQFHRVAGELLARA